MTTYSTIIYMQGDEAREVLDILDTYGEGAALDYLVQWDHGEDHDVRDAAPYPSHYNTEEWDMGDFTYVIAYDMGLVDISLNRVFA